MITDEQHETNKTIISELISVTKDPSYPKEFRDEIRFSLIEEREKLEANIIKYS